MATVDITDVRPNGNSFAESRLNPPDEVWAPPLAPNGTTAAGHDLLREETFRPVVGGEDHFEPEDPFQPFEPSNLYEPFGARQKLIAGTAIIAALGVVGLTYFFLASPGANVPAETAESSPVAVQPSSETPCSRLLLCLSQLAKRLFLRPMFPLRSPPRLRPKLLQAL